MATHRLHSTSLERVELRSSPAEHLFGCAIAVVLGTILLVRELTGGRVDDADDVFELALAGFLYAVALAFGGAAVARLTRPRLLADAAGVGRPGEQVGWKQVAALRPSGHAVRVDRADGGEPVTLAWGEGVGGDEVAAAWAGCAEVHGHRVGVEPA